MKKYKNWILTGIIIFSIITAKNLYHDYSTVNDWYAEIALLSLFIVAGWLHKKWEKHGSEILLRFLYPLVIALLVLLLGTIGFLNSGYSLGNSFYGAANLITLNSSIFTPDLKPDIYLRTARLLGGFLAAYAFLLAFAFAVGKENLSQLKFWIYRNIFQIDYYVILGDGEKAIDMAIDLLKRNNKVVFLDGSQNDKIHNELKNKEIYYFKGSSASSIQLYKTYFWESQKVFVLNESDEDNFRTVQEMDQLQISKNPNLKGDWYFHFNDSIFRERIHLILDKRSKQLNCFSIEENTARKLLFEHPVDRFSSIIHTTNILILGFDEMGQSILETLLHQSHYLPQYSSAIKVYYLTNQMEAVENFYETFPFLNCTNNFWKKGNNQRIAFETFKNINLEFIALPKSGTDLLNDDFWPNTLEKESILNVYACVDTGKENVKLLSLLLPRISHFKAQKCWDVKIFCRFNYPDLEEQQFILDSLNGMAKKYQVFCFGNLLDECSIEAIEKTKITTAAKEIAFHYSLSNESEDNVLKEIKSILDNEMKVIDTQLKSKTLSETEVSDLKEEKLKVLQEINNKYQVIENRDIHTANNWSTEKAIDKESNLRAAEHISVKIRQWELLDKVDPDIEVLEQLSFMEHHRWNAEKLLSGWIPFEVENEVWYANKKAYRDQKLHKFITTFHDLPPSEQTKDWSQVMLVLSLYAKPKVNT